MTYYYIFNIKDGGFVIISANDARSPILGYSFERNYSNENPSPEFMYWMSGYKIQIKDIVENNIVADAKTKELWNEYSTYKPYSKSPLDVTKGPYIFTRWNQSAPYNELCPPDPNCGHVLVGCVAVAMAQLMNYYKYPLQGLGSHGYTWGSYGYMFSNFADSTYNWNAFENQPTSSCIPLASFLYQCGIAVNMMYGCDGSGAYSWAVPSALVSYWNYSGSTQLLSRSSYSQAQWEQLIQDQIDLKQVLYYSGQSSSGGHAFNLDGYKIVGSTNSYHFNWGWGGQQDGWFDINNVNGFTGSQQIVVNAIPSTGYPFNCSGQKTFTMINGVFEDGSGNQDYQPNLNCSWLIAPQNPSGVEKIYIKFDMFEITDPNDVVTIYNGENSSAPVLATYKGGQAPVIGTGSYSTSSKLFVTFTTNGTTSGGGWHISYSAVNMVHCSGNFPLYNSNYSFDDGSGPTYNYNNSTTCRWTIQPENATYIKLKFNELNTEADKDLVKVFKGASTSANNLLGTYSGSTPPADTILCPDGKMTILFITDASRTAPGWKVTYKSNGTSSGIIENEVVNNISIFPNPTENKVKISFTVNTLQNVKLSMVDLVGNSVYTETIPGFVGNYENTIDVSAFAKGLYIVRIKTDNGNFNQKLVIK
jgi:hypothetical protein